MRIENIFLFETLVYTNFVKTNLKYIVKKLAILVSSGKSISKTTFGLEKCNANLASTKV